MRHDRDHQQRQFKFFTAVVKKNFLLKKQRKICSIFSKFWPSKGKILKSSKQVNSSTRKSKLAENCLRTPKNLLKNFERCYILRLWTNLNFLFLMKKTKYSKKQRKILSVFRVLTMLRLWVKNFFLFTIFRRKWDVIFIPFIFSLRRC